MSAETAGPETLGQLSEEPRGEDPGSGKARTITGKSPLRIAMGRLLRDKIALVCLAVVLFFVIVAVFAGPLQKLFGVSTETVLPAQFLELGGVPKPEYGPPNGSLTMEHPFGIAPRTATDNLAFWLQGAQNSLQIASIATLIAMLVGITLGLLGGFLGGVVDRVVSFVTDFFLTLPFILAALTIAPIINERFRDTDNYENVQVIALIGVLAGFGWMSVARLIRGEVLSLREREFVMAARVMGMPTSRLLLKELLPNLVAPIVVAASLMLPAFVAAEAGLAFLGIGVTTRPSWGQTLNQGIAFFDNYPLYLYQPLLAIVAIVLALNLLGDALRDALDPKTRR
jgi:ABC-type dipeptide/oligopeptide/nickel transport system permease subunit